MNEYNRQKVRRYLEGLSLNNLIFSPDLTNEEIASVSEKNRKEAIIACMNLCETHSSINSTTGLRETSKGKRRSVLDIWRHLKLYRPRVTIFGVMQSLYILDVEEERVVSCFCNQVRRRVFILKESFPDKESFHRSSQDEFNLDIFDWEDV